jgi:hypothetical protein
MRTIVRTVTIPLKRSLGMALKVVVLLGILLLVTTLFGRAEAKDPQDRMWMALTTVQCDGVNVVIWREFDDPTDYYATTELPWEGNAGGRYPHVQGFVYNDSTGETSLNGRQCSSVRKELRNIDVRNLRFNQAKPQAGPQVPTELRGTWCPERYGSGCRGGTAVVVTATDYRGYADSTVDDDDGFDPYVCKIRQVNQRDMTFTCSGEGDTWNVKSTWTLSAGKLNISSKLYGSGTYVRQVRRQPD